MAASTANQLPANPPLPELARRLAEREQARRDEHQKWEKRLLNK